MRWLVPGGKQRAADPFAFQRIRLEKFMRYPLAAAAVAMLAAAAPAQSPQPGIDRTVLHVQVILDMLGFGPGVLDGKGGQSLVAALKGFQEARGCRRQASRIPRLCARSTSIATSGRPRG